VVGGLVLTALPEVLRSLADVGGLPPWLAQLVRDGRLVIFGVLIAVGAVFFPHGLITPDLLRRRSMAASRPAGRAAPTP
jgi:branched-chain amino acid transport system permease protein